MRALRSTTAVLAVLVPLGGLAAGCGGSSDEDAAKQIATQEQLQRAREEGARTARQEDRIKALEQKVHDAKSTGSSAAPAPVSGGGGGSASGPSTGTHTCGPNLTASTTTTCGFAQNVRDAYDNSPGGNVSVTAYSPTTSRVYTMSCRGDGPHTCTGGNDATVYFP